MANKYVDVSATFNGDGTTSAQAASDGAPGAWNSLSLVLLNTPGYGSIDAGDTVYIRTNDGANDLGETRSTSLTMVSSATSDNPINFIFDDGTIWSDGIFTFTIENTATLTFADYANFDAGNESSRRLVLYSTYSNSLEHTPVQFRNGVYRGFYFDAIPTNDTQSVRYRIDRGQAILYDPYFNMVFANIPTYYPVLDPNSSEASYVLYNPTFNFNNLSNQICAFGYANNGMNSVVYGGKIINAIYDNHYVFFAPVGNPSNPSTLKLIGFDFGNANPIYGSPTYRKNPIHVVTASARENQFDFIYIDNHSKIEWWEDQDYPVLDGLLPDGTSWSIRSTPHGASPTTPAVCARISELYTLVPANKTISLDILIPNTYTSPLKSEYYIDVVYIDNVTGSAKALTSYLHNSNLSTSNAAWSKVLHGDPAVTYNKFKLEVTTQTEIKQYSQIVVVLSVTRKQIISSDTIFINPVLGLS